MGLQVHLSRAAPGYINHRRRQRRQRAARGRHLRGSPRGAAFLAADVIYGVAAVTTAAAAYGWSAGAAAGLLAVVTAASLDASCASQARVRRLAGAADILRRYGHRVRRVALAVRAAVGGVLLLSFAPVCSGAISLLSVVDPFELAIAAAVIWRGPGRPALFALLRGGPPPFRWRSSSWAPSRRPAWSPLIFPSSPS